MDKGIFAEHVEVDVFTRSESVADRLARELEIGYHFDDSVSDEPVIYGFQRIPVSKLNELGDYLNNREDIEIRGSEKGEIVWPVCFGGN